MHETTKLNIEKMNEKYIIVGSTCRKKVKFEPGDLVWVHLRKDWFLELRKSKLMPRATSPFKVLEKIKNNSYKHELPPNFRVSPTFNISHLRPYLGKEDEMLPRTTSIQEGEDDEDITTNNLNSTNPSSVDRDSANRDSADQSLADIDCVSADGLSFEHLATDANGIPNRPAPLIMQGPIMIARALQLNQQVNLFICPSVQEFDN
jgi:hypothetical protein